MKSYLESTGDFAVVSINGQPIDDYDDFIEQLLTLRKTTPHGFHPVEKFEVAVTKGKRKLKLVLGTDSEVNTECWVYLVDEFPAGEKFPSDNDIIGTIDLNESGVAALAVYGNKSEDQISKEDN
ncbi:MAG: hypothetical protein JXR40_02205 [Pontiellaceae bacterium]|nr:hypothetical protein [Pontiellaceae bacterium]